MPGGDGFWHPVSGGGGGGSGDLVLLGSADVSPNAASVSIPIATTSRDLLIRISARSSRAANDLDKLIMRVGTGGTLDTGANYSFLSFDGSATDTSTTATSIPLGRFSMPAANQATGLFGFAVIEMPDYAGATFKSVRSRTGFYATTSRRGESNGHWRSTSAIDVVSFYFESGDILADSSFSIYGLG